MAPPFKEANVEIIYGEGISQTGELLKIASDLDIVKKAGSWYSYNDEKIGQGSENAKKYLAEHPEIFEEIDRKVRLHYGMITEEEAEKAENKSQSAKKAEDDKAPSIENEEGADELVLDLEDTIEIEE